MTETDVNIGVGEKWGGKKGPVAPGPRAHKSPTIPGRVGYQMPTEKG